MPDYVHLFRSGRRWLATAVLLFVAGTLMGYLAAAAQPETVLRQIQPVIEMMRRIGEDFSAATSPLDRTLIILRRNATTVLRTMALGVFGGLLPALGSFANGALIGAIAGLGGRFSPLAGSPGLFLLAIVPHGIVELPAVWIASAWGMKLGLGWLLPQASGRRLRVLGATALEAG